MIVYGDAQRVVRTRAALRDLERSVTDLALREPGIGRHGALVAAFLQASELVQGVADAEFAERGCDARSPAQDAGMALLLDWARAIGSSWRSGFAEEAGLPRGGLVRLQALDLPAEIRVKTAEGHAFYAVYPEAYFEAAAALSARRPWRVLGIRSIGVGLAAVVAAALDAPVPITLRPVGHPFARALSPAPDLAAELAAEADASFAVVDEGPGLSGSSFGAVADWLERIGVPADRIHFFPSHAGDPGPRASARHRARWTGAARHVVTFEALTLRAPDPRRRLEGWVADLTGPPDGALRDLSGGAWRALHYATEKEWPAAHVQQERRKYLLRSESGAWLLKFAGLGEAGARALRRARMLHDAGFSPEVVGYRHGFLVERWVETAWPLGREELDRESLVRHLGRYIGFRARHLPSVDGRGASPAELLTMARHNTGRMLGEEVARRFDRWDSDVSRLGSGLVRIETDNRMHAWEWLRAPGGRLVKTDALDHCAAHDLVGCQDGAWDIAGAAAEFALSDRETEELSASVEREAGRAVDPRLLAFLKPCYLAFQMGHHALAAHALAGQPREAERLERAAADYAARLAASIEADPILRRRGASEGGGARSL